MTDPVEVVRANNAAFNRRDLDAMIECYAPDAIVSDQRPIGMGTHRGHEGLRDYYQGIFDNTVALREDLDVVAERDGVVVVDCRVWVTLDSEAGAGEIDMPYAMALTVKDGRIQLLEMYQDARTALAAKGLT